MLCKHCKLAFGDRPRGLCRECYYNLGIRDCYPVILNPHTRRGSGLPLENGDADHRPIPAQPTNAKPGSYDKILVLQERAAKGQQLFHPQDAPFGSLK
jgi:hypothetical protein